MGWNDHSPIARRNIWVEPVARADASEADKKLTNRRRTAHHLLGEALGDAPLATTTDMQTRPEDEQKTSELLTRLNRAVQLPMWLREELENHPSRGDGLHHWLFTIARHLHSHLVPDSIVGLLGALCPQAEGREIADAVSNSEAVAWQPGLKQWPKERLNWLESATTAPAPTRRASTAPATHGAPAAPPTHHARHPATHKWPLPDLAEIEAIAIDGPRLADLRAASPYDFSGEQRYTKWLMQRLYPSDSMLCLALAQNKALTLPLSEWLKRHIDMWQFIVPSPMATLTGLTQGGWESWRCLNNTGPRRFLVIECDFSEYAKDGKTETRFAGLIRRLREQGVSVSDMCAAILWHLKEYLPLVMVVFSGGKSLHEIVRQKQMRITESVLFWRCIANLARHEAATDGGSRADVTEPPEDLHTLPTERSEEGPAEVVSQDAQGSFHLWIAINDGGFVEGTAAESVQGVRKRMKALGPDCNGTIVSMVVREMAIPLATTPPSLVRFPGRP